MVRKSKPAALDEPTVRVRFLKAVEKLGCVSAAAALTGISVHAFYKLRHRDEAFAGAWDDAVLIARGDLEDMLRRRFTEGVDWSVRRDGGVVTVTRKFSDRLGIYVHQVLERRAQKIEAQRAAEVPAAAAEAASDPVEAMRRILFALSESVRAVRDSGDPAAIAQAERMLRQLGFGESGAA